MFELTGVYFDGEKWTVGESRICTLDNEMKFREEFAKKHNMCVDDVRLSVSKESAKVAAEEDNIDLENGLRKVTRCKDCKRFWVFDNEQIAWYEKRGLSVPKRCTVCRKKRKAANNNE